MSERLKKEVSDLNINAFIGVCITVEKEGVFSFHVQEDEERMQSIDSLINEAKEESNNKAVELLCGYKKLGVTEIVLIRGW